MNAHRPPPIPVCPSVWIGSDRRQEGSRRGWSAVQETKKETKKRLTLSLTCRPETLRGHASVFVPLGLTGFITLTDMTGLCLSVVLAVFAAQLQTFPFASLLQRTDSIVWRQAQNLYSPKNSLMIANYLLFLSSCVLNLPKHCRYFPQLLPDQLNLFVFIEPTKGTRHEGSWPGTQSGWRTGDFHECIQHWSNMLNIFWICVLEVVVGRLQNKCSSMT